jgi:alcohol dehydrogenase (NADP+)
MSSHSITTFRYGATSGNFVKKVIQRALGSNEVKIKVTHSGICYTDVHAKEKGCGLGHEGVGLVVHVGSNVSSMKCGDRVGWGYVRILTVLLCRNFDLCHCIAGFVA